MIWLESFLVPVPHGFVEALQVVGIELCVKQWSSSPCSTNARFEACQPVIKDGERWGEGGGRRQGRKEKAGEGRWGRRGKGGGEGRRGEVGKAGEGRWGRQGRGGGEGRRGEVGKGEGRGGEVGKAGEVRWGRQGR